MESVTRRGALALLAGGSVLLIFDTEGASRITGNRSSNISSAADASAYLGLSGFDSSKVYEEPQEVTVTNNTSTTLDSNQVSNDAGDLKFRQPGSSGQNDTLSLDTLAPGESDNFEIVTATDKSGKVTDTVTLSYSGTDVDITVTRDITVEFKSSGQLVYAVEDDPSKGDIKVYDAVNDTLIDPPQSTKADIIGANAADIISDSNADIPFAVKNDDRNVYTTDTGAASDTAISKGKKPKIKKKKSRLALRPWPPAQLLNGGEEYILAASSNSSEIIGVDADGTTEVLATPANGCDGVAGVKDLDGDGNLELVFADGSQQIRYLEQDGSTSKVPNAGAGSNNSTGFGSPADFGNGVEIPFINGSNNVVLADYQGNTRTLASGVAKKAAIAPVDIDGDGELEFMFIGLSSGEIKYIDDVGGSNTQKTLTINGSTVTPLEKVGLNSGT